jgi:hypothetical protein
MLSMRGGTERNRVASFDEILGKFRKKDSAMAGMI